MGHAPPPTGRWHAPWWEKRRRTVGEKRSADGQHLAPRSGARRHVPRADDRHELVGEDAGLGDGAVFAFGEFPLEQIGRASCRESGRQYVKISGGAGSVNKNNNK